MNPSFAPVVRTATALAATFMMLAPLSSHAALVQNGDFATNSGAGQVTVNTSINGWTAGGKEGTWGSSTPPVFVFPAGSGQSGVTGDSFMGSVGFYGVTAPPTGAYFIAADGDPAWAGSVSQTVNGLTAGNDYTLSFNWAGAQQQGFTGATTEKWQVTFGSDTQSTATINTPSQSFVGWQSGSMSFTASSSSQVLTFLAAGTPSGSPPWLLLNGVQLNAVSAVPEPESALMLALGLAGIGGLRRRAKRTAA
jgi:hypothetical protein